MHIGVIPARAGSTRIPGKNREEISGIPLWRIAVIKSMNTLARTIINTDDPLIYPSFCERFERDKELSGNSVRIDDVLLNMVASLQLLSEDVIHLIQPTSPFMSSETILRGVEAFECFDIDSSQSVVEVSNSYHAYSQRIIKNDLVNFVFPELREQHFNSQSKPKHYAFAGYVACKVGSLRKYGNIWGKKSFPIQVSNIEAIDIDTKEDLEHARLIAASGIKI